ncbi:phage tail tape measure protein [Bacteroides ovatus]|uniref:Phage tail tape measure protein n=1 Tax=Bacteroides ovatus TaxID=28116 RepID=A0A5M5DE45_BACOV|nr:phage tail tape measure protein [Bacteroides ovatus]KAA4005597.1 phage tail tape measure protein [Bacteroides ovatus]KAA4016907.1 phage tail tape measure protein [Bacteroides ovatus]KAA4028857.1 phage tail tape measure protein [Bacteroides ovatus]KAA4033817.1 phage tail tape measure protein [Bacteroides ovatus]
MGIQNKDGALYFATGIDNSGLYSGRQEAMGIIKAMAGEITAFDVFGGIGISAGIAFTQAAKEAYNFEKQFQQSMKEVATLSSGIKGSLTDFMNSVIDMTREVPVGAVESAKALYQIVSAGHDGADAMNILKVSAKAAIGGVTETATSADAITTILNAYKKGASEAENISDMLFTTAKLGKTTMGELGRSIAQAAPIASSFGIDIEDVLAAVVSITKQGVPTAEAMTKIRAAIMGTANHLGDAAFSGRSFQEALQLIYNEANGSTTKMKELLGTDEALQAALMITGQNAVGAASDLDQMKNASGAAEAAFKEMSSSAENQMKLLGNNITAALRPLGKEILKEISSAAQSMNEAFNDGSAQEALKNIGALIVVVTTALAGYKGSILAVSTAKQVYAAVTAIVNKQRAIEAADLVLKKGLYAIEATMIAKNTSARILLTKAIKAQTIAQLKNAAAMLTNPYVLAAAAFAGLGYAIYKCATAETDSERAMRKHNATMETQKKNLDDLKSKAEGFLSVIRDETSSQSEKLEAYKQLQSIMPNVLKNLDLEKLKTMDLTDAKRLLNEEAYKQYVMGIKVKAVMKQEELDAATAEWQKAIDEVEKNRKEGVEDPGLSIKIGRLAKKKNEATEAVRLAKEEVEKINEIQKKAKEEQDKEDKKAAIQNRAFWTKQKEDATKALESIASAQKKQMDAGKFKGIDSAVVKSYKENVKKLKEAEKELKVYDSSSKQDDQAHKLREEQEKYNLLLNKQSREQQRMKEDSANELEQLEINKLKESSEKVLRQRKLNHKLELQAIDREAEDKKLQEIEKARSAFEANPQNKKKTFNASEYVKSEPVKKQFDTFDKVANEKKETTDLKYNRGDDLADLLNQYQDYTDQRLAIERKFNEDIATLQEQRKQAVKNGDTEQVEQISRSIAQATKNKGMELMNLDYDKLKESPEYVRAFENLKETSSETLNSLLNQLENAKSAAAKVLSPDQLREYTSTIQSIMDELDSRNPFQSLSDKKKELAEAEEELANAQMELENARQTAEAVKGGAKIENGVKSSKFNEKTGKIESTKAYLSEAQALDKVKKKTENYNAAKDKVVKKDNQVKKSEKEVRAQISELADTIDELGKSIGGPAGEIISLIGSIGSFTMTAMAGVEAAADTSANAISTVEKASVILAIIGAAVQIAMKIFDMFGKDDTTEKYEKAKETYESYINILDRVIEKQLELAETLTGDTANAVYEAAIAKIKKQSENAKVLGKQYLNSGASGKSHSKGYDEVDDMSGEGWKQAAETLSMSEKEFKKKMGGRMTGLFDLTDEQLLKLQSDAGIFWSQLDSDTQKYADQIANGVGKVAEVLEQQIADTTLIDYDSLRSDFQDLLSDMDADSADFADNFEEYMRNAILNSMLKDEYMDRLTAWREKLYNAMDEGVTEDEYNALKAEGQQIADEMKARRNAMSDVYKWDKDDDEREASKKGFASMSQDSADKLDGSFAVMTSHTYSINEEVKSINSGTEKIAEKLSYLINMDKNMSEMLRCNDTIVSHLSDISNYTSNLVEIREFMYAVKLGIDTLNTKGITLKR